MTKKLHTIELFAGCGGLLEGFLQQGGFDTLACVEWEKAPCMTLANRLEKNGIIKMQKTKLLDLIYNALMN